MQNKGLCITCRDDKSCCFFFIFPFVECEEFLDGVYRPGALKYARPKAKRSCEEATEAE